MYRFLVVLLLLDALVLAAAVLLQSGKGGGLAASFGGAGSSPNSLLGSREAGNLLTKASWWCGGVFLGLAFVLQIMSSHASAPKSVLDSEAHPVPAQRSAPAPTSGASNAATPLQPVTPVVTPPATGGKAPPPAKQPPPGKQP
jgi:preprotein translocase subunit SecG